MKKICLIIAIATSFCTFLNAQTSCTDIESVLVDACGTPEGKNEMVRFRIGSNDLNTSNLTFTWSSNPWLGVCQNATTALDVAALNRSILNCGWLLEPVGGVLPAGKDILFITSENMDTLANSFANLEDTLIVVFQCGNASTGHFKNYQSGAGTRTTVLIFSGTNGCSNSFTYVVDSLIDLVGHHTAQDGASVNFTNSIPSSYYNYGCNAPVPVMSVQILTPDTTICKDGSVVLRAIAANYQNLKWKGGNGTFTYTDSLNTVYTPSPNETYPITLTLKAYKKCTGDSLSDVVVISKFTNGTSAGNNVSVCSGNNPTLTATGGVSYIWDASPFLSCTSCSIPVASPASTAIFYVNITDNHTCVNRDSVIVTVNQNDTVIVNAFDTICNGGSAVLSAYSNNGFLWTPSTNLTCSNCASPTANPSLSIDYTVSSIGICPAQKQVHLNVLLPNAININNTGTSITCSTSSVTLTASSSTTGLSYNWGSGITTAGNTISAGGVYTVTATDNTFGCTSTASTTINQNTALPNAGIGSPAQLSCNVSSVTLVASSTTSNATYNWGSGNTSSTNTVSSAGTYIVTITDPANGCTSSASTTVTSVAGTVSFTSSSTNSTCGNNNGSASVTVLSGTTPYTYAWSNNGNGSSITNLTAGTYAFTVSDITGCSASGSVSVNATNVFGIVVSSASTTCGLNNGTTTASPTSGNSPYTYLWSNGGNSASLSNLPGGTYQVTVSDAFGCSTTASVVVQSTSVNPVTVTTDTSVICSGDSVHVCATSGFSSYQWNSGQTTSCIYTKLAGNYYVSATDNAGCTVTSNHVAVYVYPQPPVSISVNGDTLNAYNSYTYQWYFNNAVISGATSPVYIASQNGYYTVAVSDTNGCRAYSLPVQILISGVDFIEAEDDLNIFPNPVTENGIWHLETKEKLLGSIYEIYDSEGKLICRNEITGPHLQIDLRVSKGIYVLKILSGQITHAFKLLKL